MSNCDYGSICGGPIFSSLSVGYHYCTNNSPTQCHPHSTKMLEATLPAQTLLTTLHIPLNKVLLEPLTEWCLLYVSTTWHDATPNTGCPKKYAAYIKNKKSALSWWNRLWFKFLKSVVLPGSAFRVQSAFADLSNVGEINTADAHHPPGGTLICGRRVSRFGGPHSHPAVCW